jgi:transcriptional regulator with XRE-family HTH domain
MRTLGFSYYEIAAEIGRRFRMRPREAYRLAWGWTLEQAAARFNERAARQDADPDARASLNHSRLSEFEHWPRSSRKPSVYALVMLAEIYETDVLCLLDLADHESLPQDRLVLLRRPRAATPFGERLVALMEARGLSAAETARRAGCSAGYLCNVIHGRKRPSQRVAARLDDLLEAGGELVTLAETAEVVTSDDDEPAVRGNPPGQAPGTRAAMADGMSLSLPYVPGRLVIEVSGPSEETARLAGSGDDRTAAGCRLALVPRVGVVGDGGTEVTGA